MKETRMNAAQLFTAISLVAVAASAQAQQRNCAALLKWSAGASDLQVAEAAHYPARTLAGGPFGGPEVLPSHCHVAGSFEHRIGADGRNYAIKFAVNMPDNWSGRYLFQGGGGLNGVVREPTGAQNAGERSALAQGFAVISNDTGHVSSGGFDASFMKDQQAMLNFYYQANAKVVELTRPMVEAYYGSATKRSYFVGCSTGGREGMIMAQRFPQLFDGIISTAPAMRTGVSNLALRWVSAELGKAANTKPRDPFTDAEEKLVMDGLLKRCDALDGHADGLIFNRKACDFDPRQLSCSVRGGKQCLADDKAAALARAIEGPRTAGGESVYASFPWDSGLDDAGGFPTGLPGLLRVGGSPPEGLDGGGMANQNVDAEYIAAMASDESLGNSATQYNIGGFVSKGGKQIFAHGEADPLFSANETERYFNAMAAFNADVKPVEEYSRLYLAPGMGHCAGGDRTLDSFDLLTPLVAWVEQGRPPQAVIATGQSMPGQSRPLCPYPAYAHYEGGDAARAASYSCRQTQAKRK